MFASYHPDVTFVIHTPDGRSVTATEWGMATARAISLSAASRKPTIVDVIIKSEAGANAWQGEKGVQRFRAYFGNKVYQRLAMRVEDLGTVKR